MGNVFSRSFSLAWKGIHKIKIAVQHKKEKCNSNHKKDRYEMNKTNVREAFQRDRLLQPPYSKRAPQQEQAHPRSLQSMTRNGDQTSNGVRDTSQTLVVGRRQRGHKAWKPKTGLEATRWQTRRRYESRRAVPLSGRKLEDLQESAGLATNDMETLRMKKEMLQDF